MSITVRPFCRAVLIVVAALVCIGACQKRLPEGADLLIISVESRRLEETTTFATLLDQAASRGEPWVTDPLLVARQYVGARGTHTTVWMLRGLSEAPTHYDVVSISDGFSDDSVRGERKDVSLERDSRGTWRITEAFVSWRCWAGRGHDSFSAEPCS